MKLKILKFLPPHLNIYLLGAVLIVFFLFGSYTPDDGKEKNKVLIELIMQGLSKSHYQVIEINNEFSKKAFGLYLKRLDFNKRFLIQADIERLKKYQYQIDDEAKNGTYEFFDLSAEIINDRIKKAQNYYREILAKPFDFEKDEMIELEVEKRNYAGDTVDLKAFWKKYLKYQALTKLVDLLQTQEKAKENNDTTIEIKSFELLEEEARNKVLKSHDSWFKRMSKIEKSDRRTVYINSITNAYDPNTAYLPPKDKENFDIAFSGRLEGIGAQLQERDGYIKVMRIVPGSASWRQGQLKSGDIILKVGQGKDEPVDIVDVRIDFAVKLIRGKKDTEVRLTVKKIDGSIIIIPIIRDIVILEETYAKSVVIDNEKNKNRIGYIKLPKFYADFNKTGGRSCAEDVKDELAKLKKEHIEGLILDLRNNSGGSLQDAVKMAGLFIERGPIVQVKPRNGIPHVLRDYDPSIQFDGPLVIMVNSFSASASEILAAAIQDYKRGIIMGSAATFGKGSVQKFYNLDNFLQGKADGIKPLGVMKLTTQKFYRIDGSSTQLKGMIPDIILPDEYTYIDVGAKEQEYAMPWDTISSVSFDQWNGSFKNLNKIRKKSQSRTQSNSAFQLVDENAQRLKRQRDKTIHSLNLEKYREELAKVKEEAKKYKDIQKEINPFIEINSLDTSPSEVKTDSAVVERTKAWHENLKKDVYIYEAMFVLKDLM